MTLRVVGAGLGRTGTTSLKLALERLLGGACYHMWEVIGRDDHVEAWHAAAEGRLPEWTELFAGFSAAVDWPMAAFYRQIGDAYPDALVLLSTRDSADTWWHSADRTIFSGFRREVPDDPAVRKRREMIVALFGATFTPDFLEPEAAMAAYDSHNARVRDVVDPGRLLEWQPGDGWEPICARLGVAVPDEPFPHANDAEDFRSRMAGAIDEIDQRGEGGI